MDVNSRHASSIYVRHFMEKTLKFMSSQDTMASAKRYNKVCPATIYLSFIPILSTLPGVEEGGFTVVVKATPL